MLECRPRELLERGYGPCQDITDSSTSFQTTFFTDVIRFNAIRDNITDAFPHNYRIAERPCHLSHWLHHRMVNVNLAEGTVLGLTHAVLLEEFQLFLC